jgi:hypothetical protein
MVLKSLLRAGTGRRIGWLIVLAVLAGGGDPTDAAGVPIDYLHPEAFRTPTWIDVSLPSNQVVLQNLRILTANRSWTLKLCESIGDPASCVPLVGIQGPPAIGWRGDFRNKTWTRAYLDRDGGAKLHLQATPVGGDWMIFRIQVEATVQP